LDFFWGIFEHFNRKGYFDKSKEALTYTE